MNRRQLLKTAAALPLAQAAWTRGVFAQGGYPTRNINMIVPFPAGGQADLAARPVALALERVLGKPVIVDNRAGGPADRSVTRRRRVPNRTAIRSR
jgi:tripartite-type tricarboxylate transporter receptor subunit TctC